MKDNLGILTYASLDKQYRLSVKPNEIQYFSDPGVGSNSYFGRTSDQYCPIKYIENVGWQKHHSTYQHNCGLQHQYMNLPRFYGYESSKAPSVPDKKIKFDLVL